jgi:hypothetical protein
MKFLFSFFVIIAAIIAAVSGAVSAGVVEPTGFMRGVGDGGYGYNRDNGGDGGCNNGCNRGSGDRGNGGNGK